MLDWLKLAGVETPPMAVHVNATSRDALMLDLESRFKDGRGFSIATLNLDHVVKLRQDEAFRTSYAAHSHVTADGNPIVWISKVGGEQVELVPGSELVVPVAQLAARNNVPIALFGSSDASLQGAAESLRGLAPSLEVAYTHAPNMQFDPDSDDAAQLISDIKASGARVVFLALGAPKQERFAARIAEQEPELGTLSIGAGLDFLAGSQVRAPKWARKLALEWLWRLMKNPARLWKRYRDCFVILPGLAVRAVQLRGRSTT